MIQIHTCEQGSADWFKVRKGMPTASEFSTVMASGKGGGESKTRKTYMMKLAGEILTGEPMEGFSNGHMERGKAMETEARDLYSFMRDVEPEIVGFITNGGKGCSPDFLVGEDGGGEIKTKLPHLLIELLERDEFPPEHKAQVQGCLWVAEREWWDIGVYWPKLPIFLKRVYRDEVYISQMRRAVDEFNEELAALVERIREKHLNLSEAA